jgi:hypothetical protein
MKTLDANGDGRIDIDEFKSLILKANDNDYCELYGEWVVVGEDIGKHTSPWESHIIMPHAYKSALIFARTLARPSP